MRNPVFSFPTYKVRIDYSQTVEQLVKSGSYDNINKDISQFHFPSNEGGVSDVLVCLVSFKVNIQGGEAINGLDREGLRPATLKELLALGAAYPRLQCKSFIVALGSSWRSSALGYLVVPMLRGLESYRSVGLSRLDTNWSSYGRFAAVAK